jgi:hypothetical protein
MVNLDTLLGRKKLAARHRFGPERPDWAKFRQVGDFFPLGSFMKRKKVAPNFCATFLHGKSVV